MIINFREILLSFLNEVIHNIMVSTYGSGPGPTMVLKVLFIILNAVVP